MRSFWQKSLSLDDIYVMCLRFLFFVYCLLCVYDDQSKLNNNNPHITHNHTNEWMDCTSSQLLTLFFGSIRSNLSHSSIHSSSYMHTHTHSRTYKYFFFAFSCCVCLVCAHTTPSTSTHSLTLLPLTRIQCQTRGATHHTYLIFLLPLRCCCCCFGISGLLSNTKTSSERIKQTVNTKCYSHTTIH